MPLLRNLASIGEAIAQHYDDIGDLAEKIWIILTRDDPVPRYQPMPPIGGLLPLPRRRSLQEIVRRRVLDSSLAEIISAAVAAACLLAVRLRATAQSEMWASIWAASWPTISYLVLCRLIEYARRPGRHSAPSSSSTALSPNLPPLH
jgi:hypothetical protein